MTLRFHLSDRSEASDRRRAACNDHLFTSRDFLEEPGQVCLGFVDSDYASFQALVMEFSLMARN
jgi:hypothetical protein